MPDAMIEPDDEIRFTLSEDIRRVLAANPGASLLFEREGGHYRSLEVDGDDIIFWRVAPDPDVATVSITIDAALAEQAASDEPVDARDLDRFVNPDEE